MEQDEAVILVVGGERMRERRALVADMLAEGRGASHVRTTKGGARIFSRESSPAPVVISTTDLASKYPWEDSSVSNVVRDLAPWISLNFLKQISDKPISVVCVVECGHLWPFSLMERLRFLFGKHRREIMVLVDFVEWKRASADHYRRHMSEFVHNLTQQGFTKNNISFVRFNRYDLNFAIKVALGRRDMYRRNNDEVAWERTEEKTANLKAFRVRNTTSTSTGVDFHGPGPGLWRPIPVILFGRTGSGMSTLAQMLTRGRLESQCTDFVAGSSIRGETTELNAGEGRGWHVVDTPGFGEPDSDDLSTISTLEAMKKYIRLSRITQGTYYRFLYVMMKDRMDDLEERLWKLFVRVFGENISLHFTVVISNADETWVEENLPPLEAVFTGCQSFVSAEFPPTENHDEEVETELEKVRQASLDHLEEELDRLMRYPVTCEFGQFTKKSQEAEAVSTNLDVPVVRATSVFDMYGMREAESGDYVCRKAAAVVKNPVAKTKGSIARFFMINARKDEPILDEPIFRL